VSRNQADNTDVVSRHSPEQVLKNPQPTSVDLPSPPFPKRRFISELGIELVAYPGVFAAGKLDAATRLLLAHSDEIPNGDLLDFGSGSGIIATMLARSSDRQVKALDISHAAVISTQATAAANGVSVVAEWADGEPVRIGPFIVTPFAVEHGALPAFGLRVVGPAEEPGRVATLAYTGDGDECAGFENLAAEADLLLAEATFAEGGDEPRGLHLTARRAGALARRAGVGRLVITHVPPWGDPVAAVAEARAVFAGPITAARPATTYVL
jgi:SAM-dependent methyltransferase